jgi:Abi-like protein
MPEPLQQLLNGEEVAAILGVISTDRFGTYLSAAGHDQERALRLYLWNAQLGEAFHTPIQAVEVGLRNSINTGLTNTFGPHWWKNKDLEKILDEERRADLVQVQQRIRNRDLALSTGQVVAGLSFGFWVGILHRRYNPPIWGGQLRIAFPDFPQERGRKSLHSRVRDVATLRNRISHHEPLIGRDTLADFSNLMTLLEWICPPKANWIRPHCRVPEIVRQRP